MSRIKLLSRFKKIIFLLLGILFTGLGFLGAVLPLLPATPFLLLAAYFFGKSSDRFLHWLLTNKICGEYIRNYREQRGMAVKDKVTTVLLIWVSIISSVVFAVDKIWARVVLFLIATAVTAHILRLKTLR